MVQPWPMDELQPFHRLKDDAMKQIFLAALLLGAAAVPASAGAQAPVSVQAIAWLMVGHIRHHMAALTERYGLTS